MTDSSSTTLYHNPNCSKSRGALELLQQLSHDQKLQLHVVEYLQSPPSREELAELLRMLPIAPGQLVRTDKHFATLALSIDDYQTAEQVTDLLLEHPALMQRPIAVFRGKAAIGRPPEDLQALYS